ncbi:hypothetical protein C5E08_00695 [Rathayibacter iranicus]|uniref:YcaO domain-containing protein n=3 Tax=Rathayibacter iranicus TaxID=59737 RepID=A0AAD1ACK9_9MICO|nr:hypothetical protein C7V51_00640 [Rathayibacter iranicus]MWV30338.1 TOMM precursor leader peptide-binding protein [Rathayibacter iranicus NCPPB 2253 = VKM Ac-1602]PPI51501.1 hypothetical protein C5E09_00695 [Rathayibacter iranicus]PPI63530.1 hypothetical protein C5E08_00695 [Rathayibacter iranicus]PPI74421.1 hypothetical protein C5E01_00675 [Rathayibacter iranicus]
MIRGEGAFFQAVQSTASSVLQNGLDIFVSDMWEDDRPSITGAMQLITHEPGWLVIGPVEQAGETCCTQCLLSRRTRIRQHGEVFEEANSKRLLPHLSEKVLRLRPELPEIAVLLAENLREEAINWDEDRRRRYFTVGLSDLSIQPRWIVVDPLCAWCGQLPVSRPEDFNWKAGKKSEPGSLRSLAPSLESLRSYYVDDFAGITPAIEIGEVAGLQVAKAAVPIRGSKSKEAGWGRAQSSEVAQSTALFEALERWAGLAPARALAAMTCRRSDLAEAALDLRRAGEHELYGEGFVSPRLDPECRWTWGYSLGKKSPILVPEGYAFYGNALVNRGDPRQAYEVSNGCALGNSLAEASLFGLLEVVERDACLRAWYRQDTPIRISQDSMGEECRNLWLYIEEQNECQVTAFAPKSIGDIPVVWVHARRAEKGSRESRVAYSVSAASCRFSFGQALTDALSELAPILRSVDGALQANWLNARSMVHSFENVRQLGDHALMHAHPDAAHLVRHLDDRRGASKIEISELEEKYSLRVSASSGDDLRNMVMRITSEGYDPMIVDQTSRELSLAGLYCVKAAIPGAVPMTFGHRNRRIRGLERLGSSPLDIPHPFP